jgi:hypothetical protein
MHSRPVRDRYDDLQDAGVLRNSRDVVPFSACELADEPLVAGQQFSASAGAAIGARIQCWQPVGVCQLATRICAVLALVCRTIAADGGTAGTTMCALPRSGLCACVQTVVDSPPGLPGRSSLLPPP